VRRRRPADGERKARLRALRSPLGNLEFVARGPPNPPLPPPLPPLPPLPPARLPFVLPCCRQLATLTPVIPIVGSSSANAATIMRQLPMKRSPETTLQYPACRSQTRQQLPPVHRHTTCSQTTHVFVILSTGTTSSPSAHSPSSGLVSLCRKGVFILIEGVFILREGVFILVKGVFILVEGVFILREGV